jgi:hypothetical protein
VDPHSPPLDDALIIVGNDIAQPHVRAYVDSYARTGRRHAVIHLSDEYCQHDISFYAAAAVVLRTYYRPAVAAGTFGLGYKQGFWDGYSGPPPAAVTVDARPFGWSFAGNVTKSDRPRMLVELRRIKEHHVHTTSDWNSPDYLPTAAYRDLMLKTVFVPSPRGNYSPDCFRTYEALEAGCVPIVLRQSAAQPFNYYAKVFGAVGYSDRVPFPQVSDWREAAAVASHLRDDPAALERLRVECHAWWTRYKEHTRAQFTRRVSNAFGLGRS